MSNLIAPIHIATIDIRHLQQNMMHGGKRAFQVVPLFLKNVIEGRQWEQCTDRRGKPFTSFEAFVTHQLWEGLGVHY